MDVSLIYCNKVKTVSELTVFIFIPATVLAFFGTPCAALALTALEQPCHQLLEWLQLLEPVHPQLSPPCSQPPCTSHTQSPFQPLSYVLLPKYTNT